MTRRPAPPRVPTRAQNLSPRNFSQDDVCGMDTDHMAIDLGNNHWSQHRQANGVVYRIAGKEMEYMAIMKDPRLQPLCKTRFWQRSPSPCSWHLGNSLNQHVFLYQTHKHPKRQKYHLRQNSLRLQTPQKRKRMSQVDLERRKARLHWRRHDFHGSHHNIQNPNQQHHSTADADMMMMDIKTTIWALHCHGLNTRRCCCHASQRKLSKSTTSTP
jgi:hypothetical protein